MAKLHKRQTPALQCLFPLSIMIAVPLIVKLRRPFRTPTKIHSIQLTPSIVYNIILAHKKYVQQQKQLHNSGKHHGELGQRIVPQINIPTILLPSPSLELSNLLIDEN